MNKRMSFKRTRKSRKIRKTRKTRKTRMSNIPNDHKTPFIGDKILCKKHNKYVIVDNMYKDGGTLLLSCGCKDESFKLKIYKIFDKYYFHQ